MQLITLNAILPNAAKLGFCCWLSMEKQWFLSDIGTMLEMLDYSIRIGNTPTFLYFDLYPSLSSSPYIYPTVYTVDNKNYVNNLSLQPTASGNF